MSLDRPPLVIADREFPSRLILGTGKFSSPECMRDALEASGADIVDLNFGCPARKVVKSGEGAGAALLRRPALLQEIARQVVLSVSVPVTAKIRLGWSPQEMNGPEVARRLEDAGIQAICVHARTRDQVHSGPVDLKALADICAAVTIPVIGNGGIRSREDALERHRRRVWRWVTAGVVAVVLLVVLSRLRPAAPKQVDLLTGPEGSMYEDVGRRYAEVLRDRGIRARVVVTRGALDNR